MSLKDKISSIIGILKDSGIEEIEVSSFWGAQKIRVSNKSNNLQQVILPQSQPVPTTIDQNIPTEIAQSESQVIQEPEAKPIKTAPPSHSEIVSPLVGTYYSASKPEIPAFVKVGDVIEKGQTICIIEAMKIFNEIESEVSGKIIEILVEDGSPVEYGQILMTVE